MRPRLVERRVEDLVRTGVVVQVLTRRAPGGADGVSHVACATSLRRRHSGRRSDGCCGDSTEQRADDSACHFPARGDTTEFHDQFSSSTCESLISPSHKTMYPNGKGLKPAR